MKKIKKLNKSVALLLTIILLFPCITTSYAEEKESIYETDNVVSEAAVEIPEEQPLFPNGTYLAVESDPYYTFEDTAKLRAIAASGKTPKYRDILSDDKKILYDLIVENMKPENITYNSFEVYGGGFFEGYALYSLIKTKENGIHLESDNWSVKDVLTAIENDLPELAWADYPLYFCSGYYNPSDNILTSIELIFITENTETTLQNINRVEKWANDIVSQANTYSSAYDKSKFVHDEICRQTKYDYDVANRNSSQDYSIDRDYFYSHCAMGIPLSGKAVCEGYAKTYKLICDKLNIPCIYQAGDNFIKGQPGHAWNLIQPDKDKWYYADLTWDDNDNGSYNYNYFLKGSSSFEPSHDYLYYNNFNLDIADDDYNVSSEADIETTTGISDGFVYITK